MTTGTTTIGALVERERRHVRRAELLSGALLGVGAATLLIAVGAIVLGDSRWLALPRGLPFAVWLLVGASFVALGIRTRRRLRGRGSRRDVTLAIETEQGMRRGLLIGVIELEGGGALAARAAQSARDTLPRGAPLAPALRRTSSRRTLVGAAAAAAGALVLLTATPLFADGLIAVLRPFAAWRGALLERPSIEGAPRELVRGAPLHVRVRAHGRRSIELSTRQTGEAWRTDTLRVDATTGMATWTLPALRSDLRLVATDGRATSDSVVVRAADRPFVGAVTLHVVYPGYLARASESLPVGEPLRLPRGAVLSIAGRASVPLRSVTLAGAVGESYPLATLDQRFSGRLVATHSVQLRWLAQGASGAVTDVPPALDIEVLVDSAPRVAIVSPAADTLIAGDDSATLSLTALDDHGLAAVLLRTTRIGGREDGATSVRSVIQHPGTSWVGGGTVDLAALGLAPGEMVRARAEAVDASPWAQRGVSRDVIIKRPTMEERRDVARALGDSAVKEARAAAAAQRSLAQRTDEAARAQSRQGASRSTNESSSGAKPAAQPKSMTFENAEKARGLAKEQRAMAERVQKLRDATRQLEQQLKAAGALDTSLARQLSEAQALLRQALTPEMMSQMQKLENAAAQMNGDQSRDALRDLAQLQQKMREQLERSAEMLKRAAHEGAMQTLGDQAKDLAQRERVLADSAGSAATRDADARSAARLAEEAKRLREQMESLKDRLAADKADAGAANTEKAGEHAAKSESGMRRVASEKKSTSASDAGESGEQRTRDAAGEMEQASESMQNARAAQVKEWKKELTTELDQAVQEMMQLAREERALESKSRTGTPGSEQRGAQSAVEQGVDKAAERLQAAGKKSALLSPRSQRAVGEAKDKVAQATQKVSQPSGAAAQQASALGEAADALTRAAASLARDRERSNSANSASGFSEMLKEMQEMAQKQGQINAQAQGLMGMPGGSPSAQALARALAQKQRGIADQLEEAGDAAGGDRAAQLAREARQLADQLDGGRLDAGTLARQQQLFRRLLDAGRSLEKEEREDSGKREAKSATGNDTFAPPATAEGKAGSRFRPPTWEELRGLSAEERRAILDYFTRLNSGAQR